MEDPRLLDKLFLGTGTGSKVIDKVTIGKHLQLFSLVRGEKRLIGLRHSHGGEIRYYAYAEAEARSLAEQILKLLPSAQADTRPQTTSLKS